MTFRLLEAVLENAGTDVGVPLVATGDDDWEQEAWEQDEAPDWAEDDSWDEEEDEDDEGYDEDEGGD